MPITKPHPVKTPIREVVDIRKHIARWIKSGRYPINSKTQFGRVVTLTRGPAWKTLREIEADIQYFFPETPDTQASISARLRDVRPFKHGLVKQRVYYTSDRGTIVHVYRLVPVTWLHAQIEQEAA